MADQSAPGLSPSESMSTQQQTGTSGQPGGTMVAPRDIPAPAAGVPTVDLLGIVLVVVLVVAVGVIAALKRRSRSR